MVQADNDKIVPVEDNNYAEKLKQLQQNFDSYFIGEGDKKRFVPARLADDIMTITKFVTMKDNAEIWAYNKGIWKLDGETFIRYCVTDILGEIAKKNNGEEVVYNIKTRTYIDREVFNPPLQEIPLANGIYDIDEEKLEEYTDVDFFTSRLPVTYDPTATCPLIDMFLSQIVKPEHVLLLKEIAAYTLYRGHPIQTAFMMIGEGANGKSVFLNLIKTMLGQDNVTSISIQDLEEKPFAAAQLYKKMANIYPDLSTKALYNTGRFKMLTGGDQLTVEKKFGQPFNMVNYAKMIYSCNQIPIAYDDTAAFHRRWIIVNFPNKFDEKTADPNLLQKLTAPGELSGFLNQLVPVLKALMARGHFSYEMTIDQRRELYKRLSDPVEAFCMDRIEYSSDDFLIKKDLYALFCEYCKGKNYAVLAENTFHKRFTRIMNVVEARKNIGGARFQSFLGVRIKEDDSLVKEVNEVKAKTSFIVPSENTLLDYNKEKTLTSLTTLTKEENKGVIHRNPDCKPTHVEELNPGFFYCANCGADSKN